MIFQQLETNFFVGKQAHQFEKFFRRNGAGAFFLHFRFAGGADAQFEIGGRDGEAVSLGLAEEIRENGNGRLALDDSLGERELVEQVKFLYAKFHRVKSSQFLGAATVLLFLI